MGYSSTVAGIQYYADGLIRAEVTAAVYAADR